MTAARRWPRRLAAVALVALTFAASGCGVSGLTAALIATQRDGGGGPSPPRVEAVSPAAVSHGGGATVTITGANFPGDATVTIAGQLASDVVVGGSGRLTCTAPQAGVVGPVDVTVTSPRGGSDTLSGALAYTNAAPSAAFAALGSPQSQNVVVELVLSDPEADPVDLELEVSVDGGGSFSAIPSADIVTGGLTEVPTSAGGRAHRFTWDSRGLFPTTDAASVVLRALPLDTTDGQQGAPALSTAFALANNADVEVELVQPGTDAFSVALQYTITDADAGDPVAVTALTWRDARTGASGPITIKSGQGVGPAPSSPGGARVRTTWDSFADLGHGNNKLVEVSVTVSDGTHTATASSAPFFVSNGPVSDQTILASEVTVRAATLGDFESELRRLELDGVSGAFAPGETITGSVSGTTARVVEAGDDYLLVEGESGFFDLASPDVLSNGAGATATLRAQAGYPPRVELLATTPGGTSQVARYANTGRALDRAELLTLPDLPDPGSGGSNHFDETLPRASRSAVIDANGDGLGDVVIASSRYAFFNADELLSGLPTVLAQAGADAGAGFADVVAHQRAIALLQRAGELQVPAATEWVTTQAAIDAMAPHVPLGGPTGYPPAASGDPSLDNVGWFVQDLVAAELDPPGAPGHGQEDLVILHGLRQLGDTLATGGVDRQSAITLRMANLASASPALVLSSTPVYLDPTDMGQLATQCAVADVTSSAHVGGSALGAPIAEGLPDIVVCNSGDASLTFYLQLWPAHVSGNPFTGGTTEALPTFTSVNVPFASLGLPAGDLRGLALGDLNGDGADDLIVSTQLSRLVLVFVHDPGTTDPGSLNVLTGGLVPLRLAGTLELPEVLAGRPALGDMTGDGLADVLVPSALSNELLIHAVAGLEAPAPPATTTPTPRFGSSGFDGDPTQFTSEFEPEEVLVGDLDGDRRLDVVVACRLSEDFSIYHQIAPGTLDRFVPVATGTTPLLLATGDVTGDGEVDVVVPVGGETALHVFSRDPDRLLTRVAAYDLAFPDPDPSLPFAAAVGDIDGDGQADDIAVSLEIAVTGGGTAVPAMAWIAGGPLAPGLADVRAGNGAPIGFGVAIGDFIGGDGLPDVALGVLGGGIDLWAGTPGGTLQVGPPVTRAVNGGATFLQALDLDADGALDLVTGSGSQNAQVLYGDLGTGELALTPATIPTRDLAETLAVALGDLGQGPLPDLVVTGFTESEAAVFYQVAPRSFVGVRLQTGRQPGQPVIGDLDGDGLNDVAIPWNSENQVAVYLQDPTAPTREENLLPPATYATATAPFGAAIVDVDGDGLLDLVVSARGANSLNVFLQR